MLKVKKASYKCKDAKACFYVHVSEPERLSIRNR